jgi:hypothetical protein
VSYLPDPRIVASVACLVPVTPIATTDRALRDHSTRPRVQLYVRHSLRLSRLPCRLFRTRRLTTTFLHASQYSPTSPAVRTLRRSSSRIFVHDSLNSMTDDILFATTVLAYEPSRELLTRPSTRLDSRARLALVPVTSIATTDRTSRDHSTRPRVQRYVLHSSSPLSCLRPRLF